MAESGTLLSSHFVSASDGAKLCCHVARPSGQPNQAEFPVAVCFDRYHIRGNYGLDYRKIELNDRGDIILPETVATDEGFATLPLLQSLIHAGFIVVIVDCRGSGASIGESAGIFSEREYEDTTEVLSWIHDQPWCNGQIGTFGRSYRGITQYLAAANETADIGCICPEMALFDLYDYVWRGGIFWGAALETWCRIVTALGVEQPIAGSPNDRNCDDYSEERERRRGLRDLATAIRDLPFRDSRSELTRGLLYEDWTPCRFLEAINKSDVPCLQVSGWYDMWTLDALLWFENLTVPQILIIGPWCHCGGQLEAGQLLKSWLVRCLINRAPPPKGTKRIIYRTINADDTAKSWHMSPSWPPNNTSNELFFIHPSGEEALELRRGEPVSASGFQTLQSDLSATSGPNSRWANLNGKDFGYKDRATAGGIVFTSAPLVRSLEMTGNPCLNLWIETADQNLALFVYLENLTASGFTQYVTEGALRLSHRREATPPFNRFDLPWRSGDSTSISETPGHPFLVSIDLIPISFLYKAGDRIQVRVTCADADNADSVSQEQNSVRVFHNSTLPSHLIAPVVDQNTNNIVNPFHEITGPQHET